MSYLSKAPLLAVWAPCWDYLCSSEQSAASIGRARRTWRAASSPQRWTSVILAMIALPCGALAQSLPIGTWTLIANDQRAWTMWVTQNEFLLGEKGLSEGNFIGWRCPRNGGMCPPQVFNELKNIPDKNIVQTMRGSASNATLIVEGNTLTFSGELKYVLEQEVSGKNPFRVQLSSMDRLKARITIVGGACDVLRFEVGPQTNSMQIARKTEAPVTIPIRTELPACVQN